MNVVQVKHKDKIYYALEILVSNVPNELKSKLFKELNLPEDSFTYVKCDSTGNILLNQKRIMTFYPKNKIVDI